MRCFEHRGRSCSFVYLRVYTVSVWRAHGLRFLRDYLLPAGFSDFCLRTVTDTAGHVSLSFACTLCTGCRKLLVQFLLTKSCQPKTCSHIIYIYTYFFLFTKKELYNGVVYTRTDYTADVTFIQVSSEAKNLSAIERQGCRVFFLVTVVVHVVLYFPAAVFCFDQELRKRVRCCKDVPAGSCRKLLGSWTHLGQNESHGAFCLGERQRLVRSPGGDNLFFG